MAARHHPSLRPNQRDREPSRHHDLRGTLPRAGATGEEARHQQRRCPSAPTGDGGAQQPANRRKPLCGLGQRRHVGKTEKSLAGQGRSGFGQASGRQASRRFLPQDPRLGTGKGFLESTNSALGGNQLLAWHQRQRSADRSLLAD